MFSIKINFILFLLVCFLTEGWSTLPGFTAEDSQFRCANGDFIFARWFCDNMADCSDNSDESYGCDTDRCGRNFTCENLQCTLASNRCDGKKDCDDGSDEKYCVHQDNITNCDMHAGKFLCKDKKRCLDVSNLCNFRINCLDESDETELCYKDDGDTCNDDCAHPCFRTPEGPQCFCRIGETSDVHPLCKEIKECGNNFNYCEQRCIRFRGVTQCSCNEHYDMNMNLCKSNATNSSILLYSTKDTIRIVPINNVNQSFTFNAHSTGNATISALIGATDYVYWVITYPSDAQYLYRSNRNGTEQRGLISTGLGNVTDISVDWITGNIYFTDTLFSHIIVCTPNASLCVKLHSAGIIKPVTLALSPKHGLIFWGTESSYPYVGRSYMDGGNSTQFVTEGVRSVSSMTVDEFSERLYWLDHKRRLVFAINLNGKDKTVAFSDPRLPLTAISVFEAYLYWTVRANISIYNIKNRNTVRFFQEVDNKTIHNLHAYNPQLQWTRKANPCSKEPCGKGICLLTPVSSSKRLTYTCRCGEEGLNVVSRNEFLCLRNGRYTIWSPPTETPVNNEIVSEPSGMSAKKFIFVFVFLVVILGGGFLMNKHIFRIQLPSLIKNPAPK